MANHRQSDSRLRQAERRAARALDLANSSRARGDQAAERADRARERAERHAQKYAERAERYASRAERLAKRLAGGSVFYNHRHDGRTYNEKVDRAVERMTSRAADRRQQYPWKNRHAGYYRNLYRDSENQRIVGVCAGLATYFGCEPWVMRMIALTGLVFIPSLTIPGYWILYFALDDKPYKTRGETVPTSIRDYQAAPAEPRRKTSSRSLLKNVNARFSELELRLRGMESHVTSSRYTLEQEMRQL